MTQTPGTDERVDPPYDGDERAMLLGYLDYHRATLMQKVAGLDAEQLQATLPPTDMTLGGMVKHAALNEVSWFANRVAGGTEGEPWDAVDWEADRDWDWHSAADDSPDQILALWRECVARGAAAIEGIDLDQPMVKSLRSGDRPTLRWVILHMIEEYARHNGHADLIRQSIDGVVGE